MKKKTLFIILLTSIIMIVGIVIATLYFVTDIFKSPSEKFWKYFSKSIENVKIKLDNKISLQENFKNNNSYLSNGKLSLTFEKGENNSKVLNVTTNTKHDKNNGRTYFDAILKNGDLDIFNISYINSEDIYAIKCDEVIPNYIGVRNENLKDSIKKYNESYANYIPYKININDFINSLKLSDEEKEYIINTYFSIVLNNIPQNQYKNTKEELTINGIKYYANVYSLKLKGDNIKNILVECLNRIKDDEQSISIINNKLSFVQFEADKDTLIDKVDELIYYINNTEFEGDFEINVYENNGEVIKMLGKIFEMIKIDFEIDNNTINLSIELPNEIFGYKQKNTVVEEKNEIIDLNNYDSNKNIQDKYARIKILLQNTNDFDINKIEIIPNINNLEENITIESSISDIKNNSYNNVYNININLLREDKKEKIKATYNVNTTKSDQIEEILDLETTNTVIANDYEPKQFQEFWKNWINIFKDKFSDKMKMLGFEEVF